mgnify:CR=1 FL=1
MTKEERIRWGHINGQLIKKRFADLRLIEEERYESDPVFCGFCNTRLPFEKRRGKFCNRSCAAKHNNIGKAKNPTGINGLPKRICPSCGGEIHGCSTRVYCKNCSQPSWETKKSQFEEKKMIFANAPNTAAHLVRRYLLETRDHRCVICSLTEWNEQPIPLVADHINGNPHDHRFENLRLICNNCDALLPTYKSKNRGNGRNFRYSDCSPG